MNAGHVPRGIDQRAALRFRGSDPPKAVAQPLVKRSVQPLETVGRTGAGCGAGETLLDRKIEDQGQVGGEFAERQTMQRPQIMERQASAMPLIGDGRIGKAVAEYPDAALQRRKDQPLDMIAPRRI